MAVRLMFHVLLGNLFSCLSSCVWLDRAMLTSGHYLPCASHRTTGLICLFCTSYFQFRKLVRSVAVIPTHMTNIRVLTLFMVKQGAKDLHVVYAHDSQDTLGTDVPNVAVKRFPAGGRVWGRAYMS